MYIFITYNITYFHFKSVYCITEIYCSIVKKFFSAMSKTKIRPIYGTRPACAVTSRIQERKNKIKTMKLQEHNRKNEKSEDFIIYDESESEDESEYVLNEALNTSYNFVDYLKHRETQTASYSSVVKEYGNRHMLTHEMFKETSIDLGSINKVFCSQWLSDRQVVFGTKCNKLMVYDVQAHKLEQIPPLLSREPTPVPPSNNNNNNNNNNNGNNNNGNNGNNNDQPCGIHAIEINPSRTLLATGAKRTSDVAVYQLPTLDPMCICERGHKDSMFDVCWLDDEFLVSGSRDTKLALWRITEDLSGTENSVPTCKTIFPLTVKECRGGSKIRALNFNKNYREISVLTLNNFIHIWCAETFRQRSSRKLPSQENACMATQDSGLYAIGCRSYTLLLDCRTLQPVKKISSRYSGCGVRSASFQGNILTIGTGLGILMFYDLRAGKYLESSINSSRTVVLKASKGYVFPDEEYLDNAQNVKYVPSIYTHCYDASGTRLFTAGGPLPSTLVGNYAGVWQ